MSMNFPTDVLVIVGIVVVGTFFTFFFGKSRGVTAILSLFGAIPLFQAFPFTTKLTVATGALPQALNVVGIFLVFVIFLYFLLDRYVVGDFVEGNFFKSVLMGIAFTAVILALVYFVLPFDAIYNFQPNIDQWFSGNFTLFWWLIAPLIIIFFI